jgi:hypothetical protein
MVKAVPHSNLVYSNQEIQKILGHYDPKFMDVCIDDPMNPEFHVELETYPYKYERVLMVRDAEQAIRYINVIMKEYPFNIRRDLAYSMWMRFTEMWDDTGDMRKAMRAI